MSLDEEEEKENQKKTRRYRIYDSLKERKTEGEYWTLFRYLVDDEEKFFGLWRWVSTFVYGLKNNRCETTLG